MGKSIAIFNQKGGVGKTTTAINFSAALAESGKRVLLVDNDPQGNLTSGVGVDKSLLKASIYHVLIDEADIEDVIINTDFERLDILPGSVDLAGAEIELVDFDNREFLLKKQLERIKANYDYIIVDCPPSLGLLTINALVAVDTVLIPIQCEYYALEGVSHLINTFNLVKNRINPDIEIQGVLLSMFDGRTNLSIQVVEEVKKHFKKYVYGTIIPRNIRLAEAPSYGLPIIHYDRKSKGAEAYLDLAEEFLMLEEEDD
ncbi:ParA family protein [Fusibacter tunisiensis]|jgi:chromosome partitioning protein|uniref:Chromosome partitioning protein n=1 Tax=Fusibacter tunisiensis TaxID=1008308 RepID=A0ABS2MNM7_9FIRM|nr:AAA family ATPase [Fusibacter tunisiensis]MBM7560996.1 chromosome partitioning protein [Fusibacter tunisiensis]